MRALAIAVIVAGCSTAPPPLATCADSLQGVWRSDAGDWMLIDRGASLEGYPLFDDSHEAAADPAIVIAPRALDLRREGDEVGGDISRRYMRGGDACIVKVPLHVIACTGTTIELVLADTSAPPQFTPCAESSRKNPSRREKWQRTFP